MWNVIQFSYRNEKQLRNDHQLWKISLPLVDVAVCLQTISSILSATSSLALISLFMNTSSSWEDSASFAPWNLWKNKIGTELFSVAFSKPVVDVSRPRAPTIERFPHTISHFSGASLIGDGGTNPLIPSSHFSIWTSLLLTYRAELNQCNGNCELMAGPVSALLLPIFSSCPEHMPSWGNKHQLHQQPLPKL